MNPAAHERTSQPQRYSCSKSHLKISFRRMAMKYHPDRCSKASAHMEFIQIKKAYEILSDRNSRLTYDNELEISLQNHTYQSNIIFDSFCDLVALCLIIGVTYSVSFYGTIYIVMPLWDSFM